jgi:hypothetical protein
MTVTDGRKCPLSPWLMAENLAHDLHASPHLSGALSPARPYPNYPFPPVIAARWLICAHLILDLHPHVQVIDSERQVLKREAETIRGQVYSAERLYAAAWAGCPVSHFPRGAPKH